MADNRTEQLLNKLNDNYEEQLFRLTINNITAVSEGEQLFAASSERAEAPSPEAQKRFLSQIDRFERKHRTAERRENRRRRKVFSKIAVVIVAVIALFALAMLTVSAFRVRVLNLLMKMEPKYTAMKMVEDDDSDSSGMGFILDKKNTYLPTYIPDGFEITSFSDTDPVTRISFTNNVSSLYFIYSEYRASSDINLDTENASTVRSVMISSNKGTLVMKGLIVTVAWEMDNHMFTIQGQVNESEAVKIAENVAFITD